MIFPLLEGAEFEALVADIREHDLREEIWRDRSGRILDGRNRLRACKEAKVKPRYRTYEGDDVTAFVISLNLHRRHLTESQRAMAGARLANLGEGRPSKTAPIEAVSQTVAADLVRVSRPSVQRATKVLTNCADELVAAVDRGQVKVSDAAAIARKPHPEQISLLGRVATGQATTLQGAERQATRSQARERQWDLDQRISEVEDGEWTAVARYDVIVFDPPWGKMSWNEQDALDVNLYASANSVLWAWTTNLYLNNPFYLMMRCGFHYKFILTWVQDSVAQRPKRTEFCIMSVKGSPKFNGTVPMVVIEAPARPKNRKPDEFYEMVDSFCIGSKLDFFAHEKRDGWDQQRDWEQGLRRASTY